MSNSIELNVNGATQHVESAPTRPLLDVLREDLDLTGCKVGCGEGACGACTVLLEGRPIRACVITVGEVAGRAILTVEGLEQEGRLHPLQRAFLDVDAMQCGYCTPGMIMAALGLLEQNPDPSAQAIVQAMNGNICRCGTYARIVEAIRLAAAELRGAR